MFIKTVVYLLICFAVSWNYQTVSAGTQNIMFYIVLTVLLIQGNYQTYVIEKQKEQLKNGENGGSKNTE